MSKPTGDPEARAAAFQRIRDAHQTEVAEDYVELIEDLIGDHGEARLVEVARYMGVSQSTANKTIQRLQRDGLVESLPYRSIFLTPKGEELAAKARRRHHILFEFLCAIGIDHTIADADAEGMEHHVSEETLEAFERLTERLNKER